MTGRILIVDDEPANVRMLEVALRRAGYTDLHGTTEPASVAGSVARIVPDLIILDLNMPGLDGFAVLDQIRPLISLDVFLPVLVLTADASPAARQKALAGGAKDFLTKPLELTEALLRIRNLLETRTLHLRLRGQNETLEGMVRERTRELDDARIEAVERLALAAEYRDDQTGRHTQRVGRTAAALAQELGLSVDQVDLLRRAAPLHDVGKIGIPDAVLLKPGRLTPDEFEVMKTHATIGGRILSGSRSPLFRLAEEVALSHHERWDGAGYPAGLAGADIPVAGRVVAVADVFDALIHERPYKPAWPIDRAVREIEAQSGRQFDPEVVACFRRIVADIGPDGQA